MGKQPITGATNQPVAAPLRFRGAAMLYDSLFVFAIWALSTLPAVWFLDRPLSGPIYQAVLALELYLYFALFWIYQGQTIGMRAWHLRLQSTAEFSWFAALKRILAAASGLGILGIGYFWMWFSAESKTWPDLVSNSQIVRLPDE